MVSIFSLWLGHTFLYLCIPWKYFLLKTGHFEYYSVAILKTKFSTLPRICCCCLLRVFLNYFHKVCILCYLWPWSLCSVSLVVSWCSDRVTLNAYSQQKIKGRGLLWWRSGWESTCQCRGHGFEPWSGKIPHATEQLGPWATATEPVRLEPVLCNKRGRDSERPTHCDEEWPPLATTRESPRTETKTQHSQK